MGLRGPEAYQPVLAVKACAPQALATWWLGAAGLTVTVVGTTIAVLKALGYL